MVPGTSLTVPIDDWVLTVTYRTGVQYFIFQRYESMKKTGIQSCY